MEAPGFAPGSVNPFHISVYVCSQPVYLDWVPRLARVPMVQLLFVFSSFHPKPVVGLSHFVAPVRHPMGGGSGGGLGFNLDGDESTTGESCFQLSHGHADVVLVCVGK